MQLAVHSTVVMPDKSGKERNCYKCETLNGFMGIIYKHIKQNPNQNHSPVFWTRVQYFPCPTQTHTFKNIYYCNLALKFINLLNKSMAKLWICSSIYIGQHVVLKITTKKQVNRKIFFKNGNAK